MPDDKPFWFDMPPARMPAQTEPVPTNQPSSVAPWNLDLVGAPDFPVRTPNGWSAGGQIKRVLCPSCRRKQGELCTGSPPESYRSDPRTTTCPDYRSR